MAVAKGAWWVAGAVAEVTAVRQEEVGHLVAEVRSLPEARAQVADREAGQRGEGMEGEEMGVGEPGLD